MLDIFKKYSYIILDFSVMFIELDSRLVWALADAANVLIPPTFNCECRQVLEVVPYRIINTYKENRANLKIVDMKAFRTYNVVDTFGLVQKFSHRSESVLVVEANYTLEDQIIFSKQNVGVYSLLENGLIDQNNYSRASLKKIDKTKTPLKFCEVHSKNTIYTDESSYVLADLLTSGAEAQIYKIANNDRLLAKIYKEDEDSNFVLTKQKLENIFVLKKINDIWDVSWLAWPTSVIYADFAHRNPIGYMMKRFGDAKFLSDNSLFYGGDINMKFRKHGEVCIKDVLDICIKFVRQILFLSINGIHISDYNDKNFAISEKNNSKIVMVDTDSYCFDGYVSECMTYAGRLSKKFECNTWLDIIEFCDESLAAFVFTLLMLDFEFGPMWKSEFRFSKNNQMKLDNANFKAKWYSVPKNLQDFYLNIFENKKPSSMNVLLYELEAALKTNFAHTRYKDIYKDFHVIEEPQPAPPPTWSSSMLSPEPPELSSMSSIHPSEPQENSKKMMYCVIVLSVILFVIGVWWFVLDHPGWTMDNVEEQTDSAVTSDSVLLQDESENELEDE